MTEPNLSGDDVLYREIVERNLGVYTGPSRPGCLSRGC